MYKTRYFVPKKYALGNTFNTVRKKEMEWSRDSVIRYKLVRNSTRKSEKHELIRVVS